MHGIDRVPVVGWGERSETHHRRAAIEPADGFRIRATHRTRDVTYERQRHL